MTENEQMQAAALRKQMYLQVGVVRQIFLSYDRVVEVQENMDKLLNRDNSGSEGGILTLFGDSRSGKSKILRDYANRHPTVVRGVEGPNGEFSDLMRVVLVKVPDNTPKTFTELLLAKLTNLTLAQIKGAEKRRFDITGNIEEVAKAVGLKLLLLEEANQVVVAGGDNTSKLATVLKDFTNEINASMVISGTFLARDLLKVNKELEGRVLYEHELTPLMWDVPVERMMFADVMHEFDRHLNDEIFGNFSGLAEGNLLKCLMEGSLGQIGHAASLIETSGYIAVDDMLAGRSNRICYEHFARAFARSPRRRAAPNAFPMVGVSDVAGAQSYLTNLIGRTRKSNVDRDFKA